MRSRMVADVEGARRVRAERIEGGPEGPRVRLLVADERRGDQQVHAVREGEVDCDGGHVGVGIGDQRGADARRAQPDERRHHVVEQPVGAVVPAGLELREIARSHLGGEGRVAGDARRLQPAPHVLHPEGLLIGLRPVADRHAAVLDGVVVLGDEIGLAQHVLGGIDAEIAQRRPQPGPAGRVQFDQRVVEVERHQVDWQRNASSHSHVRHPSCERGTGAPRVRAFCAGRYHGPAAACRGARPRGILARTPRIRDRRTT